MTCKDSKTSLPMFHSSAYTFNVFSVGSLPLHFVNNGEKLRRGKTFQAEGIVCAKAQKWETLEHIQETAIMTPKQENGASGKKSSRQARGRLGTDSGDTVTSAKKLSLQPACYSALLQNQNASISVGMGPSCRPPLWTHCPHTGTFRPPHKPAAKV